MHASDREYTEPTRKGCNRCGSHTVAWQQNKADRWYLTEVFEDSDGRTYTEHAEFHSRYCGQPEEHEAEQLRRLKEEQQETREDRQERVERLRKRRQESADHFLSLAKLCAEDRAGALAKLDSINGELAAIDANPPTMDYMQEWIQTTERAKLLRAERDFMRAALGMVTYEEK